MSASEQEFISSVITHMNQDHADTLILYVRAFRGIEEASGAIMRSIDVTGMDIEIDQIETPVRIAFDPALSDLSEIRARLVELAALARKSLAV